jgi:glycosyltransferase involved in cell wall biosynthesis
MLLGKTVIRLDIGGTPELVRDRDTGLTFELGDISDLKNKIEYLNSDKERLQEYGNNARKHVTQLVDLEDHYRRWRLFSIN